MHPKKIKSIWVRKRKSANSKIIYGPQIANPQIVTFAEDPQIKKIYIPRTVFTDLRFAELVSGPQSPLMIIEGKAFCGRLIQK